MYVCTYIYIYIYTYHISYSAGEQTDALPPSLASKEISAALARGRRGAPSRKQMYPLLFSVFGLRASGF